MAGKIVDCEFASPADKQAELLTKPTGLSFPYLISHAELVNTPYAIGVDEWLTNDIDITQRLFDEGEAMGKLHGQFFSELSTDEKYTQICAMRSALVLQMEKTCQYEERKSDFESVARWMMEGFAFGVKVRGVTCN